jgi:hypothetical protein
MQSQSSTKHSPQPKQHSPPSQPNSHLTIIQASTFQRRTPLSPPANLTTPRCPESKAQSAPAAPSDPNSPTAKPLRSSPSALKAMLNVMLVSQANTQSTSLSRLRRSSLRRRQRSLLRRQSCLADVLRSQCRSSWMGVRE